MSPLAYAVKLWREIRLIIFGTLAFMSLFSSLLVQESMRWLISMSRLDECTKTLDRISVFNRLRVSAKSSTATNRRFEARRKKLTQMFAELDAFNKHHAKVLYPNKTLICIPYLQLT